MTEEIKTIYSFDPKNQIKTNISYQESKLQVKNNQIILNQKYPLPLKFNPDVPITDYQPVIDPNLLDSNFEIFADKCVNTGVAVAEAIKFLSDYLPPINWTLVLTGVTIVGIKELAKIITEICKYKIKISIEKDDNQQKPQSPEDQNQEFNPDDNENVDPNAPDNEEVELDPAVEDEGELIYLTNSDGYLVRADGSLFLRFPEGQNLIGIPIKPSDLTEEELKNYCFQSTVNSNQIFNPEILPGDIDDQFDPNVPEEPEEEFPVTEPLPPTPPPEEVPPSEGPAGGDQNQTTPQP